MLAHTGTLWAEIHAGKSTNVVRLSVSENHYAKKRVGKKGIHFAQQTSNVFNTRTNTANGLIGSFAYRSKIATSPKTSRLLP